LHDGGPEHDVHARIECRQVARRLSNRTRSGIDFVGTVNAPRVTNGPCGIVSHR
jgi:hypothetical protein